VLEASSLARSYLTASKAKLAPEGAIGSARSFQLRALTVERGVRAPCLLPREGPVPATKHDFQDATGSNSRLANSRAPASPVRTVASGALDMCRVDRVSC